jgi:hypothetical protein
MSSITYFRSVCWVLASLFSKDRPQLSSFVEVFSNKDIFNEKYYLQFIAMLKYNKLLVANFFI